MLVICDLLFLYNLWLFCIYSVVSVYVVCMVSVF